MQQGRYDGSFGKIPEMGDPEYEDFAANPYSFRQSEELLERQKKRCEDYKKSLKKKDSKKQPARRVARRLHRSLRRVDRYLCWGLFYSKNR